jgi:branched-chain amino acid transport system substrate-binding protein
LDDGFNPARTVEQTRKLIDEEQVLLLFGSLGTVTNNSKGATSSRQIEQPYRDNVTVPWPIARAHPTNR